MPATDKQITWAARKLYREGFLSESVRDRILEKPSMTRDFEESVAYFQQTHIGPHKKPLAVDGILGPNTVWALKNAGGKSQRNYIQGRIPKGITGTRYAVLETALSYHGAREKPWGSNRGPVVDRLLPQWIVDQDLNPAHPWCAYAWNSWMREACGAYPFRRQVGSVYGCYRRADREGSFIPVDDDDPIPGDAFVMLYKDLDVRGPGHIGLVLRANTKQINTVEGNSGNRVKVGLRNIFGGDIVGWIRHPDLSCADEWERGIKKGQDLSKLSTR